MLKANCVHARANLWRPKICRALLQIGDRPGRREAAFCHNLFVCPARNVTVGTRLINQRELSWTLRTFVKRPRPADDGQKRCRGTTLNGSIF